MVPWLALGSLKIIYKLTGLWLRTSVTIVKDYVSTDDHNDANVQGHDHAQDAVPPDTQSAAASQPASSAASFSSLDSFSWSLEGHYHPHPPLYCRHSYWDHFLIILTSQSIGINFNSGGCWRGRFSSQWLWRKDLEGEMTITPLTIKMSWPRWRWGWKKLF